MMQAIDASLCSRIGISTQRIEEPGLVKAPAPVLVGIGEYQYKIAGHIEPLYNLLTPGSAFFYFFREEIIDILGILVKQLDQMFCYELVFIFMAKEDGAPCP
jgi:hypothetical protein